MHCTNKELTNVSGSVSGGNVGRHLEKLAVDVDWEGASAGLFKSTEGEREDGRMKQLRRKCHNVKQVCS